MAEKAKTRPTRNSNILLMVVSAVAAFILWLIMSLTAFPDSELTFKDVEIDYSLTGSFAEVAGISIMNKPAELANVKIKGQRYLIGDYGKDDIHIGLDLDSVRAPGQYDLKLIVTSKKGDAIETIQIEPQTVKVEFDYMVTKTFSVSDGTLKADISNITAASGYVIDPNEVEISPSSVEISGPRDYVNQVTSCVVNVKAGSTVKSNIKTANTALTLYNGSNVLSSDKISVVQSSFELNIPVYMRKELKPVIQIQPYSSRFEAPMLKYTIDPDSISVRSQNEKVAGIDEILLGYIPLNRITVGTEFTFPIQQNTNYYTNISGNTSATVRFDLEGYSTKNVTINNAQMNAINVPSDYRVTIETDKLRNITIVGPSEMIEQIDSKDVVAELDMLEYSFTEGLAMYYVQVYLPEYPECWCYGQYQVYLNIDKVHDNLDVDEAA